MEFDDEVGVGNEDVGNAIEDLSTSGTDEVFIEGEVDISGDLESDDVGWFFGWFWRGGWRQADG